MQQENKLSMEGDYFLISISLQYVTDMRKVVHYLLDSLLNHNGVKNRKTQ